MKSNSVGSPCTGMSADLYTPHINKYNEHAKLEMVVYYNSCTKINLTNIPQI